MKRFLKYAVLGLVALIALAVTGGFVVGSGIIGPHEGPGQVTDVQRPAAPAGSQILFGDFHVHTTLSADAFLMSLPILGGEGSHPQADACDFARFCSALDFWSINDHAETLTQRRWEETISSIKACNKVAGDPNNPDTVAFLGWEWTQMGDLPSNHYGHRNVILGLEDDVPTRPIAARAPKTLADDFGHLSLVPRTLLALGQPNQRSVEAGGYYRETELAMKNLCPDGVPVRDLPADCMESAASPAALLDKLEDWGLPAILIPHGTTWGNYTPPGSDWRKQLTEQDHNASIQTMVEVYSGHGAGEVYRPWRGVQFDENNKPFCPQPSEGYLPSCWRAGQIIQQRCLELGEANDVCATRAAQTRQAHVERGAAGQLVVPAASVAEWLDAGQCTDCFLPAFNYRPLGSAQYMLALSQANDDGSPLRFRFGFIGSSDNHAARPGTGYKELNRREMTEATGLRKGLGTQEPKGEKAAQPDLIDMSTLGIADRAERARISSFMTTGGLVAVHSQGRSRGQIWNALEQRQVYGTSGDRILLWFDLHRPDGTVAPMGSQISDYSSAPHFTVNAVGAFKQKPGCPQSSADALGAQRLYHLCRNECYHPSDERKLITRIEIIKITPQLTDAEPIDGLIQDPWRSFDCAPDADGCQVSFSDPDYLREGRDAVYYARAVQEPSDAINGANLRCTYDQDGNCIKVNPCFADEDGTAYQDDCLAPVEERAWSSPIFVDISGKSARRAN